VHLTNDVPSLDAQISARLIFIRLFLSVKIYQKVAKAQNLWGIQLKNFAFRLHRVPWCYPYFHGNFPYGTPYGVMGWARYSVLQSRNPFNARESRLHSLPYKL